MAIVGSARFGGDGIIMRSVLAALPEASLQVRYQATASAYTFEASDCDFGELEAALEADATVADPRVIADLDEVRVYRVRPALDRPLLSEVVADEGVQILDNHAEDGEWHVQFRLPDREALATVRSFCEAHDVAMRVDRLYTETAPDAADEALTPAQREALVTAYEMGYLAQPRECSLADVAAALGISSSAASGRLRRAVAALTERHVNTARRQPDEES